VECLRIEVDLARVVKLSAGQGRVAGTSLVGSHGRGNECPSLRADRRADGGDTMSPEELLGMRILYADEWTFGLFCCVDCKKEWADDLPPLWWPDWPSCAECGGQAKLFKPLDQKPLF
jgi:hypothetical protein